MSKEQLSKILEDTGKVIRPNDNSTHQVESFENIKDLSQRLTNPKDTFGTDLALITIEDKAIELLDYLLNKVKNYSPADIYQAFVNIGYYANDGRRIKDIAEELKGRKEPSLKILKNTMVNELISLLKNHSFYLTHKENNLYIFNTEFWVRIEDQQMLYFLRDVAIKMGGPRYAVGDVKFAEDMYKQLKHEGLFMRDTKPNDELLLNLQDGTLHITHDVIDVGAFNYQDYLRYQLPIKYNPLSINQDWLNFIEEILPQEESRKTLQQALGFLLLRGLKIEKIILLYGTGSNGKSVIFEVLSGLLGEDSFSNYSLNSLTSSAYYIAQLKDKIINYSPDIDLSKIDTGKMKILASGEPIECKVPNKEPFIMKNYARMIFNINNINNIKLEDSKGFFRRLLFIPFNITIAESKQDKKLPQKLLNGQENKAGILNWILDGAREVLKNEEIYESPESQNIRLRLQKEANSIEAFITEYRIDHDNTGAVQSSVLLRIYEDMCKELMLR